MPAYAHTRAAMDPAILDDIAARLTRCRSILLDPRTMPQDRQRDEDREQRQEALDRVRRERES